MTILNNLKIDNNSEIISDICIIGSGISGQTISSTLKNKNIVIVESGGINFNKNVQSLNSIDQVGLKLRENFQNRIRQLGGSANLWANQLMWLEKNDLSNREWISSKFSWPFNYDEIESHYKDVIDLIYQDNFKDLHQFNKIKINNFNSIEKKIKNLNELDFNNHIWPSNTNKFNIKNNFTKNILNSDKIRFIHNFTATKIFMNNEKQTVEKIKIQSKYKYCYIKSNIFILACGAIENARILLNNSKNNLLNNKNVGRYFMDHPRTNLGVIELSKKSSINSLFGLKHRNYQIRRSIRLSKKFQNEKKILDGYAFLEPKYSNKEIENFELFLKNIKKIIKFSGIPKFKFNIFNMPKLSEQIYLKMSPQISNSFLNNFLRNFYEKTNYNFSFKKLDVNYQGEQLPNYNSRIYLSEKKDYYDQNLAVLDWQLNSLDYKTQEEFVKVLFKLKKYNSGLSFIENNNKIITDASHHTGTTRMSLNRIDGVVDKNCKFHDIKNLYLAGSSVFRAAYSINPGFTNMAMSIRLGKYINSFK